ncbi:MAG: hypothetical protein JO097_03605 [Acidobacteriaceae bacterium]|nr:hypothetical protein [Acidobacteriaceae bacterium]MBV9294378.1 hypothetical protein [Acidobacteriaceae bacterium]MBV9767574.1 hypothetical protein [Acidobacteriaceae bacterium]
MMKLLSRRFLTILVVCLPLLVAPSFLHAQYPGQAPPPYPPGQYPPGQGPLGTGGVSLPSHHKKSEADTSQPSISADGRTVSNDGKKLVIATSDGRTLTMRVTSHTKFTQSGEEIAPNKIVPKTTVHVEAAEDDESNLTAAKVDLLKDVAAGEDTSRPSILDNPPDAPDRPILRRGIPQRNNADGDTDTNSDAEQLATNKPRATAAAPEQESTDFTIDTDSDQPRIVHSRSQDLIAKTKEWSDTFTNGLPNYVCQQITTRYAEESKSSGWEPLDVLTAAVVYENGREEYRNITVGGKRTNKSMLELGGSTSTGEFASTLHSLFSESSQAQFKLYHSTNVGGSPATIYDFKVALANSDWFIAVGGQTLHPAYSGSVWIDRATAQVRRIEMQAQNIPKDFPLDAIEWAVDYDEVPLGTLKFLLPVHAENLACQRGSTICTKNTTDFRDYHKYSGESTITFK